ncbi:hypothetical protein A6V39_01615 [Candidatus Mycoplasma haematobovis]|uniref:Uncharacterized protein n=1 Tax=Candidatus Mycoplasma haematobovis TaxID=432608 RepID=A0A1A9QG97_9MOLU|nr:hypothetical protein [Candidatus Mycoplasma haematobovis]OAL10740.1 hypothetical protein A6V39_01615 [Candidatus Mycoplasma haematobovis]
MRYKNLALAGIAFTLAVFYALYKRSPTIQQSLIKEGFQLVSNSEKKKEIYNDILERHKEGINSISLDQYLIDNDRKWEALSFWCDLGVNNNSFFRTMEDHKKYCVMAIEDSAKDTGKKMLDSVKNLEDGKVSRFVKQYLIVEPKNVEELGKKWLSWCQENKSKPLWRATRPLSISVYEFCYYNT